MNGTAQITIDAAHPALAGHFPGRPIVPGVVLLDHVVRAIEAAHACVFDAWALDAAKFVAPVGPGAPLTITWARDARGAIRFEIQHADARVASGVLRLASAADAP